MKYKPNTSGLYQKETRMKTFSLSILATALLGLSASASAISIEDTAPLSFIPNATMHADCGDGPIPSVRFKNSQALNVAGNPSPKWPPIRFITNETVEHLNVAGNPSPKWPPIRFITNETVEHLNVAGNPSPKWPPIRFITNETVEYLNVAGNPSPKWPPIRFRHDQPSDNQGVPLGEDVKFERPA
jgi:hypothetical protein